MLFFNKEIYEGLPMTLTNICDGAFSEKLIRKNSAMYVCQGLKYAFHIFT